MRKGHQVDYFVTLVTKKHTPWRNKDYFNHLVPDESFSTNLSIHDTLQHHMQAAGGTLAHLELRDEIVIDADPRLKARRDAARRQWPNEDPDLRFPVRSLGSGNIAEANRNIMRMFSGLELLWNELEKRETKYLFRYDHVFVLRDDAHFLQNFNLSWLLRQGPASMYVLACDARSPVGGAAEMLPSEINDYVTGHHSNLRPPICRLSSRVASRSVQAQYMMRPAAEIIGRYFSQLFDQTSPCVVNDTRPQWRKQAIKRGLNSLIRPCTSEELLKSKLDKAKMKIVRVPQRVLPFQRALRVRTMGGIVVCLHKYCQSKRHKLPSQGIQQCTSNRIRRELPRDGFFSCTPLKALRTRPAADFATPPLEKGQPELIQPWRRSRAWMPPSIAAPQRLLIYSIVLGDYDDSPSYHCRGFFERTSAQFKGMYNATCLFLTDNQKMADVAHKRGWEPVLLPHVPQTKRMQRSLKIQAALPALTGFEFVIYHDGKLGPTGADRPKRAMTSFGDTMYPLEICHTERLLTSALDLLNDEVTSMYDLVAFSHNKRNSTAQEFKEVTLQALCSKDSLKAAQRAQLNDGYPDAFGLADTSVMIRRFRGGVMHGALKAAMFGWWSAMTEVRCMRDQVTFEHTLWKHGLRYVLLPDKDRPFVKVREHRDPLNIRNKWVV